MTKKIGQLVRLDQLLVARGLADSRTRAQALVMAGAVFQGTRRLDKPGQTLAEDADIVVRGRDHPWVSRGGLKLVAGLDAFGIDPTGRICIDVGASTGGFTHVLLTRGAARVFAVDVGYGQLSDTLRSDPRVVVLERTNARHLTSEQIPQAIDLVVCDASFIGLKVVLPASLALTAAGADLVALVKPQFEVGRGEVGRKGVVRDPDLHRRVCEDIRAWLGAQPGWTVIGLTESPITGPEGNVEFLIGGRKAG